LHQNAQDRMLKVKNFQALTAPVPRIAVSLTFL